MNPTPFWKSPLVLGFSITIAGVIFFSFQQHWDGIQLALPIDQLVTRLSPLILASAFIERAVEILVSPWRDGGATKLHRIIDAIQARPANPANPAVTAKNAADLKAASDDLDEYRTETQRYAFAANLILSLCVAAAGLRALYPFLAHPELIDPTKDGHFDIHQIAYFRIIDVILTTALLAGGADGFHGIITAISNYFPPNNAPAAPAK